MKSNNKDTGLFFAANLLVNVGNYGLNILLARTLGPELFAEANILAAIILVLSFIAMGVQLSVTKFIAEADASQNSLMSYFQKKGFILSLLLTILLIISAPMLKKFLGFQDLSPLVILFAGIPFYMAMSINRGYHQGRQSFNNLSASYLIEMLSRVIITLLLVFFFGESVGLINAVAVGFLISFLVAYLFKKPSYGKNSLVSSEIKKRVISVFMMIGIYELSQVIINNSDIFLVKHFFNAQEAGLYSTLALLGKAVFFATWVIVMIIFPKIIEKNKRGEETTTLFWKAFAFIAFIGCAAIVVCAALGEFAILITFGSEYISISSLLWKYALATTLFALANIFVYYYVSLENYIPVAITIIFGTIQVISIWFWHQNLETVITVQILIMTQLLLILTLFHNFKNKSFQSLQRLQKLTRI